MKFFWLFIFLLFSPLSFGQEDFCGTDKIHNKLMLNDSSYKKAYIEQLEFVKEQLNNPLRSEELITIPVVVHVIHLGESQGSGSNISESQIKLGIQNLNLDFQNSTNNANLDIRVNFCLATTDPFGNPTRGINRVNGFSVLGYNSGISYNDCSGYAQEQDLKAISFWPHQKYLNIWVVHNICNSIAGYAYYGNMNWYSGIVIEAQYFSATTLTHEMGHCLGLRHTFDGEQCNLDSDCAYTGDGICDTPAHLQGNCSSNSCSSSVPFMNSSMNYMSYCSNKNLFTQGQKDRMRIYALNEFPNTLNSLACSLPPLGIDEKFMSPKFSIYPNPNEGLFHFESNSTKGILKVINLNGEIIWQQEIWNKETMIDIIQIQSGFYILQFENDLGSNIQTFVIE